MISYWNNNNASTWIMPFQYGCDISRIYKMWNVKCWEQLLYYQWDTAIPYFWSFWNEFKTKLHMQLLRGRAHKYLLFFIHEFVEVICIIWTVAHRRIVLSGAVVVVSVWLLSCPWLPSDKLNSCNFTNVLEWLTRRYRKSQYNTISTLHIMLLVASRKTTRFSTP